MKELFIQGWYQGNFQRRLHYFKRSIAYKHYIVTACGQVYHKFALKKVATTTKRCKLCEGIVKGER